MKTPGAFQTCLIGLFAFWLAGCGSSSGDPVQVAAEDAIALSDDETFNSADADEAILDWCRSLGPEPEYDIDFEYLYDELDSELSFNLTNDAPRSAWRLIHPAEVALLTSGDATGDYADRTDPLGYQIVEVTIEFNNGESLVFNQPADIAERLVIWANDPTDNASILLKVHQPRVEGMLGTVYVSAFMQTDVNYVSPCEAPHPYGLAIASYRNQMADALGVDISEEDLLIGVIDPDSPQRRAGITPELLTELTTLEPEPEVPWIERGPDRRQLTPLDTPPEVLESLDTTLATIEVTATEALVASSPQLCTKVELGWGPCIQLSTRSTAPSTTTQDFDIQLLYTTGESIELWIMDNDILWNGKTLIGTLEPAALNDTDPSTIRIDFGTYTTIEAVDQATVTIS